MRKNVAKKRILLPDPRFNDTLVTRFVNSLMISGKKSTAFKTFYNAIDIVDEKTEGEGLNTWKKALTNVCPSVEVKSRRVGGATFQIPREVKGGRKIALGIGWLINFSKKRNEKSMAQKLAAEILSASKEEGAAYKKKEDTHRMAEANKAFSHFRF